MNGGARKATNGALPGEVVTSPDATGRMLYLTLGVPP